EAPFATTSAPAATLGGGAALSTSALATPAALSAFDTRTLAVPAAGSGGPVTSPPDGSGAVGLGHVAHRWGLDRPGPDGPHQRASLRHGTGRVVAVTINGTQAEALDAAGDFFTRLTVVPGQNPVQVQATDDQGHTATATLTIDGASPQPGTTDVSSLADV